MTQQHEESLRMIRGLCERLLSRCDSPGADVLTMAKQLRQTADLILRQASDSASEESITYAKEPVPSLPPNDLSESGLGYDAHDSVNDLPVHEENEI